MGSLQAGSGLFGIVAAHLTIQMAARGVTATALLGIGFGVTLGAAILVATVIALALGWLANEEKGNQVQHWLERSYWGLGTKSERYAESDKKNEIADFNLALEMI